MLHQLLQRKFSLCLSLSCLLMLSASADPQPGPAENEVWQATSALEAKEGAKSPKAGKNGAKAPQLTPKVPQLEMEDLGAEPPRKPAPALGSPMQPLEAKAVVVDIVSDTLEYDTEKNLYIAVGGVHVIVSEQNTDLEADKVIYDPKQELMIAEGNVIISNKGEKTFGTYAKIDLTRKSALINDPITSLEEVRVKAKQAFVTDRYLELENGKLVIPPKNQASTAAGYQYDEAQHGELSQLALANPLRASDPYENSIVEEYMNMDWDQEQGGWRNKFRIHSSEIEVHRSRDGYDEINLKNPKLKFGNFTLMKLPQMDFAHFGETGDVEYLGPDIGIDPDLGGFYMGPGLDFRLGKGVVRFSPLLSYGAGRRRSRRGQVLESADGAGFGGLLNYMSHDTKVRLGYTHKIGTPVIYARHNLFGTTRTRAIIAANEDYNQGYLGWERPKYIAQITDSRKLFEKANIRATSFSSIGVAHDEFFPTNDENYFVQPKSSDAEPVTAGRVQLQTEFRNVLPLLTVGSEKHYANFGVSGQVALSGYTTGDFVGILRAGPNVRMQMGDRFSSYVRYFYAASAGESPFVFDTYYRGRNSVLSVNQVRINKYVTMGMRTNVSLARDNATSSLFTGNSIFLLLGPDDVKLNLAYDFIRQRSFFGINYIPGNERKTLHYDRMKIYQPADFEGNPMDTVNPNSPMAMPGNPMLDVQDVGMMNGNRAR